MDVDPLEYIEDEPESDDRRERDRKRQRLNTWVAITVALLATFMGICKVKDDNLVQAMQQAQAQRLDDWSYYQARNIRSEVAEAAADELRAQAGAAAPEARAEALRKAARFAAVAAEQAKKRDETRAAAEADQKEYDRLNFRDDQFDLSDTLLALAISLLAMTALTGRRWLYWVAMVPIALGVLMGLAGLLGWRIHPDWVTRLLS